MVAARALGRMAGAGRVVRARGARGGCADARRLDAPRRRTLVAAVDLRSPPQSIDSHRRRPGAAPSSVLVAISAARRALGGSAEHGARAHLLPRERGAAAPGGARIRV